MHIVNIHLGDSITIGNHASYISQIGDANYRWPYKLSAKLNQVWPGMHSFSEWNLGVSGSTAAQTLATAQTLPVKAYDVRGNVFIAFGTNEIYLNRPHHDFYSDLHQLISIVKNKGYRPDEIWLIGLPKLDAIRVPQPLRWYEYQQVFSQLYSESFPFGSSPASVQQGKVNSFSYDNGSWPHLPYDGVHLSAAGHTAVADRLYSQYLQLLGPRL